MFWQWSTHVLHAPVSTSDRFSNSSASQFSSMQSTWGILLLGAIGFIWLLSGLLRFLQVLLDLYILPGIPLSRFGCAKTQNERGQGSWAVVTGASDGLGREFALQLASKGFNIFLASRSAEKLSNVAIEIENAAPGIKTRTHTIDFAAAQDHQYAALQKSLQDLDIGILVNNVGRSHAFPVPFVETSEEEMLGIAEVNIKATLRVTRMVAPGMVERKRGLILNLSSFAGLFVVPLLTTYAASKAFLIAWSQGLGEELRRSDIIVQNVNAFFVVSNMSKVRKPSTTIPLPKPYVARVLSKIGRSGGGVGRPFNTTPWPAHGWMDWAITSFLLGSQWLLRKNYDDAMKTRKRALKKISAKSQ